MPVVLTDLPSGSLNETQAKALFTRFGVPCTRERIVSNASEAETAARELGDRVVLKILSADITHKSDVGGVVLNITPERVGERLKKMQQEVLAKSGVLSAQFLVQEMVGEGVELILGLRRDVLGTAILLGMGGVSAELLQDTVLRLLPEHGGLSHDEALTMAHSLKIWPLLNGYRGRPKADVEALAQTIVAFSQMAAQLGERVLEAEINPVFVLPQGQGVRAADGVLVLA
jgi:succinyl-CoA synthetase beta subunit